MGKFKVKGWEITLCLHGAMTRMWMYNITKGNKIWQWFILLYFFCCKGLVYHPKEFGLHPAGNGKTPDRSHMPRDAAWPKQNKKPTCLNLFSAKYFTSTPPPPPALACYFLKDKDNTLYLISVSFSMKHRLCPLSTCFNTWWNSDLEK